MLSLRDFFSSFNCVEAILNDSMVKAEWSGKKLVPDLWWFIVKSAAPVGASKLYVRAGVCFEKSCFSSEMF